MFLKRTLFCVLGVTQCLCGLRFKKHYFPHTVHYCCSSMLRLSETSRFLESSSFWEVRCALIGLLSSALWLAEYLKRETEMLCPLPYYDAEQIMWAKRSDAQLNITLCGCALLSVAHGQSKRSANVPLTLTGKPNPAQITLWHKISAVGLFIYVFIFFCL